MVNFSIQTTQREDFITLQEILDETILTDDAERKIHGLKIDDENYDNCRITYSGKKVYAYVEFNRVNGHYDGILVIETAPKDQIEQFLQISKQKLPELKENPNKNLKLRV